MSVILISGWKGHGKSTYAQGYDESFIKMSFATPLKEEVRDLLWEKGCNVDFFTKDEILPSEFSQTINGKRCLSIRNYYQEIALLRKKDNPYYYVEIAFSRMEPDRKYVIDDFRFLEEFYYLQKRMEVKTLRIVRAGAEIPGEDEISEHLLDDFSFDQIILLP